MIFLNDDDMLFAFDSYYNNRKELPRWAGSTKNPLGLIVTEPPSIVKWAKWMSQCEVPEWEEFTLKDINNCMKADHLKEAADEITALIENDIITNALIGNYSANFAQKYLQQKHGWENLTLEGTSIHILGRDAIKELTPKPN